MRRKSRQNKTTISAALKCNVGRRACRHVAPHQSFHPHLPLRRQTGMRRSYTSEVLMKNEMRSAENLPTHPAAYKTKSRGEHVKSQKRAPAHFRSGECRCRFFNIPSKTRRLGIELDRGKHGSPPRGGARPGSQVRIGSRVGPRFPFNGRGPRLTEPHETPSTGSMIHDTSKPPARVRRIFREAC